VVRDDDWDAGLLNAAEDFKRMRLELGFGDFCFHVRTR
jgi:hypothetical protein